MTSADAKKQALARASRPLPRRRTVTTGDGRACPLSPSHGAMVTYSDGEYCPHQSHDGTSRAYWRFEEG